MRRVGTWIVMTGFTLIAISTVVRKSNTSLSSILMKNGSMEAEYKVKIRSEVEEAVKSAGENPHKKLGIYDSMPEVIEKSTMLDNLYADAKNKRLYISDGVIVDFDGSVLDQYSGITCLENGALVTEDGEVIENLFVGTKEQIYYALSGAVESGDIVEVELIIINQTGTDICSFYASPTGTDQWGENLLEESVLSSWANTGVKCKVGKDTLRWNFAFEDEFGKREEIYDVDLSSCREDFIHLELWRADDGENAYVELY